MSTDFTVPSPRPAETSSVSRSSSSTRSSPSAPSAHSRRPSIPISPSLISTSPRAVPRPVPPRHGSLYDHSHRASFGWPSESGTRHRSNASSSLTGSILLGPASLPSSSFPVNDSPVQRSKSERRPSNVVHFREKDDRHDDSWLDVTARDILAVDDVQARVVPGTMVTEEAVDILIKGEHPCLLVELDASFGFFDYADLNTFLLLVLQASSSPSRSPSYAAIRPEYARTDSYSSDSAIADDELPYDRSQDIVRLLRRNEKVKIRDVCDISQKDPYHALPTETPVRTLLPLFASGLHRIAITSSGSPQILTAAMLLEHLISLPPGLVPPSFSLAITSPALDLPLNPFISLSGTASVLDAMQVMSGQGMSALGVLSGAGSVSSRDRRESSGSSSSSASREPLQPLPLTSSPTLLPTLSPGLEVMSSPLDAGELMSVVTTQDCTTLVVPSEGKQVLGMGLGQMVKGLQVVEDGGKTRGEEKMPVHTITFTATLLHACNLILATSSSRIFLRTPVGMSPPLSPTPSLTMSAFSPPPSPSISTLSLVEHRRASRGLPPPPPTQFAPHYVISILDILACLAKAHHSKLVPPSPLPDLGVIVLSSESPIAPTQTWDLDPGGMGKKRRVSSAAVESRAIESWRWAGDLNR